MIIKKEQIETVSVSMEDYMLIKQQKIRSVPVRTDKQYIQIVYQLQNNNPLEALICVPTVKKENVTHFKKKITINYVIQ